MDDFIVLGFLKSKYTGGWRRNRPTCCFPSPTFSFFQPQHSDGDLSLHFIGIKRFGPLERRKRCFTLKPPIFAELKFGNKQERQNVCQHFTQKKNEANNIICFVKKKQQAQNLKKKNP